MPRWMSALFVEKMCMANAQSLLIKKKYFLLLRCFAGESCKKCHVEIMKLNQVYQTGTNNNKHNKQD